MPKHTVIDLSKPRWWEGLTEDQVRIGKAALEDLIRENEEVLRKLEIERDRALALKKAQESQ